MDSLINRWKNANSLKKSVGKGSRENSSEAKNTLRESGSGSKGKREITLEDSSSEEEREHLRRSAQRSKKERLEKIEEKENNEKPLQLSKRELSDSRDKPLSKGVKKTQNFVLDEAVYKIVEIFKYGDSSSPQEKNSKVRKVLESILESQRTSYADLEAQIAKIKQENLKTSMITKIESSSKTINDMEARIFEYEREKIQTKKERDLLQSRIELLEKEVQTQHITLDMYEIIKDSQKLLEKNNKALLYELEVSRQRNADQQKIWEAQVEEMAKMIEELKRNLRSQEFLGKRNLDDDDY